jgi:methionyl-tRNA formyltransferase
LSTVFLGTSEFAAAILERLAGSATHRPALVITRPDRPSGRGRRLAAPPVAERARALGLALEQPENVNEPDARALIARALEDHGPTLAASDASTGGVGGAVIVCAFGALIKEPLLSEHELLNVHPSLLPRWRGAAPIERAIMAGDAQTGVSIMRLTAGLDSGPVCLTGVEPIQPQDTYGLLSARLQELGAELLIRALEDRPAFLEQPADGETYAEKIAAADRLLDPSRPAIELERVVRALDPHIGARVQLADDTLLGVKRAALAQSAPTDGQSTGAEADASPATPADRSAPSVRDGRLLLNCNPGVLELLVVCPPGGRTMDASDYLRGHGLPGRR